MQEPIAPHGGQLVQREIAGAARADALREAEGLPAFELHDFELSDLEMIASGAMSPLTGFLSRADFDSVLDRVRLSNGLVWSIPIVFARDAQDLEKVREGGAVALRGSDGTIHAILRVRELYAHDRERHAVMVFGTDEPAHPGVARVLRVMGDTCVAGDIDLVNWRRYDDFSEYRLSPRQTREHFAAKGWKTIVAFQTRNPVHRAHEYLTKVALEIVDGLLLHPLVGETKAGDTPAEVRMRCYKALLDGYYPPDRVLLSVFPAAMRYGGPREAVFHAISRKNYGVTHFIVGRDHAGVNRPDGKPYYGSYDAQQFVSQFSREELGIEIFRFENTFYDRKTGGMVSDKTKPAGAEPVSVSGTQLREMLLRGELPPVEFTRPEVARILMEDARQRAPAEGQSEVSPARQARFASPGPLAPARTSAAAQPPVRRQGFCLWFTGLSGAGKSTLSRRVAEVLRSRGRKVEILDGDEVRENLSKGLGFSREDRDTNIRRIGYVCHLLARNGVVAISAAISPYRAIRDENRQKIQDFVEVFVKCSLETLIRRDAKGLYRKAIAGEIKNFTGISDPYEEPLSPEVTVETDRETVEESVTKIIRSLELSGWA